MVNHIGTVGLIGEQWFENWGLLVQNILQVIVLSTCGHFYWWVFFVCGNNNFDNLHSIGI